MSSNANAQLKVAISVAMLHSSLNFQLAKGPILPLSSSRFLQSGADSESVNKEMHMSS